MNGPKYVFKSLGGHDSDNSVVDCIFFCEPHISGYNNEGYITRHFVSVTKINGDGRASILTLGDEKLFRKVEAAGFTPTLISFRNGYNVVGIYPSNTLADAYQNLLKAKAEPFCPSDVWILVNE